MPTVDELIGKRRKELIDKGYKPGIVGLAMRWAEGSARGVVGYGIEAELTAQDREKFVAQILPRYLNDCETWMQSFGHQAGEASPPA
jgi:hypothetical protein